ncbi:MAG: LruC domain-containing protein [Nitritalea sp.]
MNKLHILFFSAALFLFTFSAQAQQQVTNDMELGDRGLYTCWVFQGFAINSTISMNGNFSARSGQVTNNVSLTAQAITTPWLRPAAGNITFKIRPDGGAGTSRRVLVSYIPVNPNTPTQNGTPVTFFTQEIPDFRESTVRTVTVPVPAAIVGQTHRILISFLGEGGTGRFGVDDIVVPGEYWADPTNNCLPKVEPVIPPDVTTSILGTNDFSTLMFEDLWPGLGDYDFNDFVVGIKAEKVSTALDGILKEIKLEVLPRAAGATFRNSFAVAFPTIPSTAVTEITGTVKGGSTLFSYQGNGAEAGQSTLSVIIIENINQVIPFANNPLRNESAAPFTPEPFTVTIKVRESAGIKADQISYETFDPYLIVDQNRGREIHLPGRQGTSLSDPSLLGTSSDNSLNGLSYTSTARNLPWALLVPKEIPFMQEGVDITEGYLNFPEWARSAGDKFPNWFENNSGFRNNSKLFR